MAYSWQADIEKLMLWRAGTWSKYECNISKAVLRIHCDQLLIIAHGKILESLNMNAKMKGIFKNDILIVISCNTNGHVRKIKFQITSNVQESLQKLGQHFSMVNHSLDGKTEQISKFVNLDQFFKQALEAKGELMPLELPSSFNNFVKLCLLDPTFPQLINETQKILNHEILKK